MFTAEEREAIRAGLIELAREHPDITACAITGSASVGTVDRWSDIDLAFGVSGQIAGPLADFTRHMAKYGIADTLDVPSGSWLYRVFLLKSSLQVDLAFVPERDFGSRGPTFQLVFGEERSTSVPKGDAEAMIGWAWLYALHVRSSIARGKVWQADYMLSGMRNQVLSLACLARGLPFKEGRGVDRLPIEVLDQAILPRSLDKQELRRAFTACTNLFIDELKAAKHPKALALEPVLRELAETDSS